MPKATELIESKIKRIEQKIQIVNNTLLLSMQISLATENFTNGEIIKNLTNDS